MQTPRTNKMESAPVNKLLLTISLPIMFSMIMQAFNNIIDTIFIARFSEKALSAVSLTFSMQTLMIAISIGTYIGIFCNPNNRYRNNNIWCWLYVRLLDIFSISVWSAVIWETFTSQCPFFIIYGISAYWGCSEYNFGFHFNIWVNGHSGFGCKRSSHCYSHRTICGINKRFYVSSKLQNFIFMPIYGLTSAMLPIMSYNLGARHKNRVLATLRYSIVCMIVIMLSGTIIFQLAPGQLLKLFGVSEDMISMGVSAVRIISFYFVFEGFCLISQTGFQSFGKGFVSLVCSIPARFLYCYPLPIYCH